MKSTSNNQHIRFAVLAADIALFTLRDGRLFTRLIDVNRPPHFVHIPGLPGGLLKPDETAEQAAKRHTSDKAGIGMSKIYLEQLYTFSDVDRDPRGRVVAVAYLGLVPWEKLSTIERVDTREAKWADTEHLPKLAYDHSQIVRMAMKRLASRITYTTLVSRLLPEAFTLTELENAVAAVIGKKIDKRNFRKKMEKLGLLKQLAQVKKGGAHRPARLYAFKSEEIEEIEII